VSRAEPRPSDVIAGVLSAVVGVSSMVLVTLLAGPSSEAAASAAIETPRPPAETVSVSIIDASMPTAAAGPTSADPPPRAHAHDEPTPSVASSKPTPRSRKNAAVPTPTPSGDTPAEPTAPEPTADPAADPATDPATAAAGDAPPGDAGTGSDAPAVGDEAGGGGDPAGDGSGGAGEAANPAIARYRNELREWLGERFSVRGTGLPASVLRSRRIAATIRIDGDRTIVDASAKPTGDTGFDEATAAALDHLRGQQLPATPDDYPGPLQTTIRITFVCPVGACS
jgi:hypothetical protein